MKISALAFATILGSSSAFTPASMVPRASSTSRSVLASPLDTKEDVGAAAPVAAPQQVEVDAREIVSPKAFPSQQVEVDVQEVVTPKAASPSTSYAPGRGPLEPGRYNTLEYSVALPFLKRPPHLDGTHAGDMGFDPCGLAQTYDMYYMQESELRHARLAMLAVVGWPLSELVAPDVMLQDGRAPSVLNGFTPLSFAGVVAAFSIFGFFEYKTALRCTSDTALGAKHKEDMSNIWDIGVAGDYNFDPAGLYSKLGDDAVGRKALRGIEIVQGRLAMLAVTYFAWFEAVSGKPIVEDNPFFHPNAGLPLLAISYAVWSQFYQVSDTRKFPITIEYTKDGEEMLRGLKRAVFGDEQ